jgi:hypothetical protein
MAIPAATIASSSWAVVASRAFRSIRSPSWSRRRAKARIVTTGPSGASGGSTAWNRSPPGRRASTQGRDSSTLSPSGATTRCTRAATAAAEGKRTAVRSMVPSRSTKTSEGPLTRMSVTSGSAKSDASGPSPDNSSLIARTVAARSAGDSTIPSSPSAAATATRRRSASVAAAPAAISRRCTRSTSPAGTAPVAPVLVPAGRGTLPGGLLVHPGEPPGAELATDPVVTAPVTRPASGTTAGPMPPAGPGGPGGQARGTPTAGR